MGAISLSQAMKAIKNERCCECSSKAKGLIYRGQIVRYYCKKCLHQHIEKKDRQVAEVAASPT